MSRVRAKDLIWMAMREQHMGQSDLAKHTGLSAKHVNQFIHGKVPVSARVALLVEYVLGLDPKVLVALELDAEIERARAALRPTTDTESGAN